MPRHGGRRPDHVDPAAEPGALGDRVADQHLVVAVGERRVRRPLGRPAGDDVGVDRPEERPERVAEALDVAARQRRGRAAGGAHQRRVADAGSRSGRSRWPSHRWSGVSESQAADGASSRRSPTGASSCGPALICETADRAAGAVVEAEQDRRGVLGRHVALDGVACCARSRTSRPGRAAARAGPDERGEVGHHRDDRLAGQERHQVEPVRPDVADRPERAALVGLEPPVPVGLEQQPVLEVVAGDEPDVAEVAGGDELADVLVERVEADVEVDRVDEPARRGELDQLGGLGRGHRQRLLADDVPAGGEDRPASAGRGGRSAR